MRKIALLIVLMTVIALTSYAADIAVSINCSSELVFGVDLNEPAASGFNNNNTAEVDFTIVEGDAEKGKPEDGAVYGWIKLTNYSMKVDNMGAPGTGDNGDVEAKTIFPSGWVKISSTNNSLNYVEIVQNDDSDNDNADKGVNDSIDKSDGGGFVLGLTFAPVAIEVGVFSIGDWDATDIRNEDHAYGINLKATVDVAPIKVEGGFEMCMNNAADDGMGAGAKITANIAPLTIYAGLDATIDGSTTVLEYGFGVSVAIAGITVTADGSYNEDLDGLDVRTKIDASGLVPNLGLSLMVELFNLTGDIPASAYTVYGDTDDDAAEYEVLVNVSYNLGTAKPYAEVSYATYDHDDDADEYTYKAEGDEDLSLKLGVELYVIPNVTFTLEYASGDLTEDTVVVADPDAGIFYFKTKIAL
jgi:hypothetical protein